MKRFFVSLLPFFVATQLFAQVDIEHRRTIMLQSEDCVYHGEETIGGAGFFWYNENHVPWDDTALRVIFAGVYLDTELSYFVAGNTNTAIGIGFDGGVYADDVNPYVKGERLAQQSFDGDDFGGHVFINQTIPNPTPLPLNIRASYYISKTYYRHNSSTENFILPPDFITQSGLAELRFGGIEPGLLNKRGLELYLSADANYRDDFAPFGPVGGPVLGDKTTYERLFGRIGARIPIGPVLPSVRVFAGYGNHLDELSAYKLGGNIVNIEPYTYTLHGYYLREIFADRFVAANLALSVPLNEEKTVALHGYGDWAVARGVPPLDTGYHNYFGTGAGFSFRTFWETDVLLSYGYGFNAVRNDHKGGHEVGIGFEKQF